MFGSSTRRGKDVMVMRNIFTERMDPSVKGNRNDPVKVAPQVYKVLLENDQVRLLEITLNPGGKVPMHSHPDYVIYCLSAGKVRFTSPEGQTAEPEMKKGHTPPRTSATPKFRS
jgi:quercetin dioxygenase-like cupin family protein